MAVALREPATRGHATTTTPATIVRAAKRNPLVLKSPGAAKACGNLAELPADIITWLLKNAGAVGQWRMRAVCKIFRSTSVCSRAPGIHVPLAMCACVCACVCASVLCAWRSRTGGRSARSAHIYNDPSGRSRSRLIRLRSYKSTFPRCW